MTFTQEGNLELTAEKLLVLFDVLPDEFIQKEGIEPPKAVVERMKQTIRQMMKGDL